MNQAQIIKNLRKTAIMFLLPFAIVYLLSLRYSLAFNQSDSFQGKLYLIRKINTQIKLEEKNEESNKEEKKEIQGSKGDARNKTNILNRGNLILFNKKEKEINKSSLKRIIGMEGDIVSTDYVKHNKSFMEAKNDTKNDNNIKNKTNQDNNNKQNLYIFLNKKDLGSIKTHSLQGKKLYPIIETGKELTIPKDYYFVYSNHKDSYDSRYKSIGLIHKSQILGKAYEVF